jgi:hypothetical protein
VAYCAAYGVSVVIAHAAAAGKDVEMRVVQDEVIGRLLNRSLVSKWLAQRGVRTWAAVATLVSEEMLTKEAIFGRDMTEINPSSAVLVACFRRWQQESRRSRAEVSLMNESV